MNNEYARSIYDRLLDEMTHGVKGGLYHATQIRFAYNSNRIEGSRLSEEQTRYIFETNAIDTAANVDDIIETVNHFACFDCMLKNAKRPLGEDMIKRMHAMIKRGTSQERLDWFNAGEYKALPNVIGGRETTPPGDVAAEMKNLIGAYARLSEIGLKEIVDFHFKFEQIHPFQDGNGRVGRMLLFKECLAFGVTPFIIDERHKLFYYRGLGEYEKEPGFLLGTCESAQDDYIRMAGRFFVM
ncbi:MAG: Fic family protein [Clostridiales Family XIII bacterium]|jgi:Fic family protein|nr:Fic family protein [Clostridiales Family XIII bacterium]